MNDSLQKPVTYSLGFHAALFFVLFVKMALFPNTPIEIKRSIRVDMVALPDKVMVEAPAPAEAPPPVAVKESAPPPEPAKMETPKVPEKAPPKKDVKKSQNSALNKLKAMSALEKIKQEQAEAKKAAEVKGNQAAKGNSLTGLEQIEYDRYFDQVENAIRANWSIPQWLSEGQYRAQALVLIDGSGRVIKKEVIKSSGNDIFDSRVIAAIDESSPFPAPPERLKDILASRGIVFNFPE